MVCFSKQFGFRTKRSTIGAPVEIREQNTPGSIDSSLFNLLDLRNEFAFINHDFLSAKLEKHGVRGICLKCFESISEQQSQCVQVIYLLSDF